MMESIEQLAWIRVREAAVLEGVTVNTIYRRCSFEYPASILWKDAQDGRLVDLRSLSPVALNAWLLKQVQFAFLQRFGPQPETDPATASALSIPANQCDVVFKRLKIVEEALSNFRAAGFQCRADYLQYLACHHETSVRTIWRWCSKYRRDGLRGLADTRPGPAPSGHPSVEVWMRTWIMRDWIWGKLTKAQCYASLILKSKQLESNGIKSRVPSRTTISQFITSLGPLLHAYRNGPLAVKRAFAGIYRALGKTALVLLEWPAYRHPLLTGTKARG